MQLFGEKVALVTGAASGIGRAAALLFAQEGARVAVVDINIEGAQETERLIESHGGEAHAIKADLSSHQNIRDMVAETIKVFGRLDAAFNNAAMTSSFTDALQCTEEEWDRVMTLNVKSIWLCMKYQIPEMLKVGGGAIVNTSSAAGIVARPGEVTYITSKHAVLGLTKSAAVDFGKHNVRINALCPGVTDTPMAAAAMASQGASSDLVNTLVPMGRFSQPEEQAEAVVWLCSEKASYMCGAALVVDGGYTLL
jgi:NAD(P)-dependent dehydrogenase (short-subunit alcohol dehydrogenase family)